MVGELLGGKHLLDHYYVRLRNNCLGVIVGNMHSLSYYIGYVKYCLSRNGLWRNSLGSYERVLKKYSARDVYMVTSWRTYIPCYDSIIPIIPSSMISKVYDPLSRSMEIITSPKDQLEETTAELLYLLSRDLGELSIGITGSLLPGIHNPRISDIDLVVYGWRSSLNVIEYIIENKDLFPGFPSGVFEDWIRRNASATGLSFNDVRTLYRRWRRGVFRDKMYSIIFNDGVFRSIDNCDKWRSIGYVVLSADLSGGLEALNYPSKSLLENYRILKTNTPNIRSEIKYVLSFEALYIGQLFDGGRVVINGLLQYNDLEDYYRVVVGVREYNGYIKPIS
jgi:predicted nucleotidyltransferase